MKWTDQERAEPAAQYARIGYVAGERWPAAPPELSPEQLLSLFRRIADGADRSGLMAALAEAARSR